MNQIKALWNKLRAPSALTDYLSFASIIFLSITLLCIAIGWILQSNLSKQAQDGVSQEAHRIKKEIVYLFEQIRHFMSYFGKEMVKSDPVDLFLEWQKVIKTFENQTGGKKSFLWPDFGWINAEHQQILNTRSGVLATPIDSSIREYTYLGPKFPWTLHFSSPGPAIPVDTNGIWVLPMGMGITDDNGVYLGSVGAAFHIPDLIKNIERVIKDRNIEFAVLDRKGNIILQTLGRKLNEKQDHLTDLQMIAMKNTENRDIFPSLPFYHTEEIESSPFILVTYLNRPTIDNAHYQTLIPHYLKLFGGGISCLILIYFFLQSLIKKNRELQEVKLGLENAIALAEASDLAKEEFLNKIKMELTKPFVSVVTYTDILLKHLKKEINLDISPSKQMQFLNSIREAAMELKSLSTNVLDLGYIDVKSILEDCLKIHAKHSFMKGVNLKSSIPILPPLYVDELRFKQIIIGLLSQALRFAPKGESIDLTASIYKEEKTFLKIILKDSGYGLTEEEWQRVATKYSKEHGISRRSDGTDLELSEIERLIEMHKGKYSIEHAWKKGTTVTLLFPYLKDC